MNSSNVDASAEGQFKNLRQLVTAAADGAAAAHGAGLYIQTLA